MFKLIFKALPELFKSWIDMKKAKHEAEVKRQMFLAEKEAEWDVEAMRNSRHSLKDELITVIWFSPFIVAWFDEEKAQAWVDWVQQLPYFYWVGAFGIIAASFGLRWYFKDKNLQVGKKNG